MALPGGDVWSYRPPLSLWRLVEEHVTPEEQEELRSMLGTSLIETTLDLHNEVETLLEIWQEYQDQTEMENVSRPPPLAEPPHLRERLVKEICFLAEGVREKSVRKGMNPSDLFTGHNSQILEYAEEVQRSGSAMSERSPMSARTSNGRFTPLSPSDVACSRNQLSETIQEDVASSAGKLNYMNFDQVRSQLRETLTREADQLEADVVFLHGCLDQAADLRSQATTPCLSREPTLTELREERSLLEKELLSSDKLPRTPASLLSTPPTHTSKMQNLTPMKTKLRPPPASSASTSSSTSGAMTSGVNRPSSKTGPLRACHPAPHPSTTSTTNPPPPKQRPHPPTYTTTSSSASPQPSTSSSHPSTSTCPLPSSPSSSPAPSNSPIPSSFSPDSGKRSSSATSEAAVNRITAQIYDLGLSEPTHTPHPGQLGIRSHGGGGRGGVTGSGTGVGFDGRRIDASSSGSSDGGSGGSGVDSSSSRGRIRSDGRGGSGGGGDGEGAFEKDGIRRRDGSGSRHRRTVSPARVKVVPMGSLLPTPPSSEKPQLPRPSSADRFRKMVMHSRETI